ncbi:unnamed protein product, partial [marine sediment metagenome]
MKIIAQNNQLEFQIFNDLIDFTKIRPMNPRFIRIAGNPTKFDEEFKKLKDTPHGLVGLQQNQAGRGFRSAQLIKSGRGWSVYIMNVG